jgi:hypothetical protein
MDSTLITLISVSNVALVRGSRKSQLQEGVFRETKWILVSEGFILDGIKKGRAISDPAVAL